MYEFRIETYGVSLLKPLSHGSRRLTYPKSWKLLKTALRCPARMAVLGIANASLHLRRQVPASGYLPIHVPATCIHTFTSSYMVQSSDPHLPQVRRRNPDKTLQKPRPKALPRHMFCCTLGTSWRESHGYPATRHPTVASCEPHPPCNARTCPRFR